MLGPCGSGAPKHLDQCSSPESRRRSRLGHTGSDTRAVLLRGVRLWEGFLIQGVPRGARKGFPPQKGGVIDDLSSGRAESEINGKQPTKTTGGKRGAPAFSNDIPEATEKHPDHSPAYLPPVSIISSPHPEERATQDDPDPPSPSESPVPAPQQEVYRVPYSNAGTGVRYAFENLTEPQTTTQGKANIPPTVTASTPLSLRCRMCNAPPTVGARPTVTMCGHLFCSEYVLRIFRNVAATRLTLCQVYNTTCDINSQMSCVRQRPVVVLFIQTRSPSVILGVQLLEEYGDIKCL
jgi:hypothetical protein